MQADCCKRFGGGEPPSRGQREEAGNSRRGRSWFLSICNPQSAGNKILTNKIRIGQHTTVLGRIINIRIHFTKGLSQTLSQLTVQKEG